jgi:hypothetical protein
MICETVRPFPSDKGFSREIEIHTRWGDPHLMVFMASKSGDLVKILGGFTKSHDALRPKIYQLKILVSTANVSLGVG